MRRAWVVLCCVVAWGAVPAAAADDAVTPDGSPSLEYRPPRPILPEPKGPTPVPPVTLFRESFGDFGIGRGSFDEPTDVAFGNVGRTYFVNGQNPFTVSERGRTYVLDSGNNRVQLFDKANNFILEWGGYGSDEKRCQFREPSAIFVLPGVTMECSNPGFPLKKDYVCEVVLVLDTGNNRIQWFKVPIGKDPAEKLPNFPCGHDKSVFGRYLDPHSNQDFGDYGDWGESGISDNAKFNRPLDITFEGEAVRVEPGRAVQRFSVLDAGNERIQSFELALRAEKVPECWNTLCFPDENLSTDTIGSLTGERGNLKSLVSLAWSREESFEYLYLLGTGCTIQKFKRAGSGASRTQVGGASGLRWTLDAAWPAVAPESGLCVPVRVRFDRAKEYVYVLDSGNSLLSIFHRSGNFISALQGADRAFDEPGGFTFIPESGEFAVADTGNDLVQKFTLR